MRSSSAGRPASSVTTSKQLLAGHFARRAPGGRRRRAPWLRRCASGDRPRRTGTAPGSTACPPPPVPKRRPRRSGRPSGRPARNAAGMSRDERHHFALQPGLRRNASRSSSKPPRRSDGRCAPAIRACRNSGQLCARRLVQRARPWLPPVISTLSTSPRGLRRNAERTLRAPAVRSPPCGPRGKYARGLRKDDQRARHEAADARDW